MEGLIEGRMVHYFYGNRTDGGKHRAAVITHVWNKETGMVNLYVFPDGSNALVTSTPSSVKFDPNASEAHTWHWIEKA